MAAPATSMISNTVSPLAVPTEASSSEDPSSLGYIAKLRENLDQSIFEMQQLITDHTLLQYLDEIPAKQSSSFNDRRKESGCQDCKDAPCGADPEVPCAYRCVIS